MDQSQGPEETQQVDPDDVARDAATALFHGVLDEWVHPEIERRVQEKSWTEDAILYRFQVQFFDDEVAVRINEEVKGILEVKAVGPIEKGQVIYEDNFSEIVGYQLPEEYAHHPHISGWAHHGVWSLLYQLGHRDPGRHRALASGRDYLGAAHEALVASRIGPCFDLAYSAVELLARAELLSCAPAISFVQRTSTHDGISAAYNAWSRHLGNGEPKFANAFNQLKELRRQARYGETDMGSRRTEAEEMLGVLDEMEKHVTRLAEAPMHELPDGFQVIATRELKAGELVSPDAMTIFPSRSQKN